MGDKLMTGDCGYPHECNCDECAYWDNLVNTHPLYQELGDSDSGEWREMEYPNELEWGVLFAVAIIVAVILGHQVAKFM